MYPPDGQWYTDWLSLESEEQVELASTETCAWTENGRVFINIKLGATANRKGKRCYTDKSNWWLRSVFIVFKKPPKKYNLKQLLFI